MQKFHIVLSRTRTEYFKLDVTARNLDIAINDASALSSDPDMDSEWETSPEASPIELDGYSLETDQSN
jgi:hypothetical protein